MALFGGITLGLAIAGVIGFFIGNWHGKEAGKEEESAKWKQAEEWKVKKGERHE